MKGVAKAVVVYAALSWLLLKGIEWLLGVV
jgi:hypothetical protein